MFHHTQICLFWGLNSKFPTSIPVPSIWESPPPPPRAVYTLLRQRCLRWIGHVHRMDEGRIPKQLLYGELAQGKKPVGRRKLHFKDVVKRDMQAIGLPIDSWETHASDGSVWKTNCAKALQEGEKLLHITVDARREHQKARALAPPTNSTYVCGSCHHICRSRIGLQSHLRKCSRKCTITNSH